MDNKKILTKDERISKEEKRLSFFYRDVPDDVLALNDGLIKRAAYMRIALEDYEKDLDEGGYCEMFTQSPNAPAYQRERPVARLYNAMNKNYQSIMKQLRDTLPKTSEDDAGSDLLKFALIGNK